MKAIILAGGLGTRLKPFTEVIPKPLLPIGESSVLEIQILSLKKHGIKDIIIATNYMADYVQAFLGTARSTACACIQQGAAAAGHLRAGDAAGEGIDRAFFLMNGIS